MDLKEFVSMTLTQIVAGVVDSATRIADMGGAVNPAFNAGANGPHLGYVPGVSQAVYGIEFDVAVVAGSNTSAEGGASLKIATVFSAGGKAGGASKEETTSRIKFIVPLTLPVDAVSKDAVDKLKRERDQKFR